MTTAPSFCYEAFYSLHHKSCKEILCNFIATNVIFHNIYYVIIILTNSFSILMLVKLPQSTPYKPVRSTMALMKIVSSRR